MENKIPLISQSLIKDYVNEWNCKLRVYKEYWQGIKTPSSLSMQYGLLFETLLIGESRGGAYNGEDIPKLKSGAMSKPEQDVRKLAVESKQIMNDMGIKCIDVQPEWKTDTLIGHPDLVAEYEGKKILIDIKFTQTKEDDNCKWNPYAWGGDLSTKDYTQAKHYVYMAKEILNEKLPFYYLIFGKSGWVKFLEIEISKSTLDAHAHLLKHLQEDLVDFVGYPTDNPKLCKSCPHLNTCESATLLPKIEKISI